MAPKIKVSYEEIVNAALQVVREKGLEAVNARSVAARLGCSIQPIFRTFGTMEELRIAILKRANKIYEGVMEESLMRGGFREMCFAYVIFAQNEKNIFKMMFMSNALFVSNTTNASTQGSATEIMGTTAGDDIVLAMLCDETGLDAAKAKELYTGVWFLVHGMASLLVYNSCTLSDDEIKRILKNTCDGYVSVFNNEKDSKGQ